MNRANATPNQSKDYILQNKQKFQSRTNPKPAFGTRSRGSNSKERATETLNKDLEVVP